MLVSTEHQREAARLARVLSGSRDEDWYGHDRGYAILFLHSDSLKEAGFRLDRSNPLLVEKLLEHDFVVFRGNEGQKHAFMELFRAKKAYADVTLENAEVGAKLSIAGGAVRGGFIGLYSAFAWVQQGAAVVKLIAAVGGAVVSGVTARVAAKMARCCASAAHAVAMAELGMLLNQNFDLVGDPGLQRGGFPT